MLSLGAHGVHHDQWRTRSARQVAKPALAFVTLPGRVEEMGTRAGIRIADSVPFTA
jgi:hypothetical protein